MRFTVERTHPRVLLVRVGGVKQGVPVNLFLSSDLHVDSVHCKMGLLKQHLDEAKRRNALVLLFGDIVDAMQGKADPRGSMDGIIEPLRREDYYDALVDFAANVLSPVQKNLVMLAYGNHETKVLKWRNTDIIQRVVGLLRQRGSPVEVGAYGGWVLFRLYADKAMRGRPLATVRLYYHHGATIGAPVSKGTIEAERMAAHSDGADIVVAGHNHRHHTVMAPKDAVSERGVPYRKAVWYVRTPGYKDEWTDEPLGFAQEKRQGPKPVGSVLVQMMVRGGGSARERLRIRAEEWIE